MTAVLARDGPGSERDRSAHSCSELDAIVMRGLDRNPARRYETAREMALELERCMGTASAGEVGAWVEALASARS